MKDPTQKIIGVVLSVLLIFAQAGNAYAVYSPVLSKEVSEIKQDVMASRQQNGVGSWLNAMEKVSANNVQLKKQGLASGTPGSFEVVWTAVKESIIHGITESFLDGFSLLLGTDQETKGSISACLREDIWTLQALQEEVINEMFKAGLLADTVHSYALLNDYRWLQARIDGGKRDVVEPVNGVINPEDYIIRGLKTDWNDTPDWSATKYWFPGGDVNYYRDCPSGEFTVALQDAVRSLNNVVDTFSQQGGKLGSLADMWAAAEKRAVKRAADYIAKNQIKVSFGGEAGANPQGLINGYGGAGLSATLASTVERITAYTDFLVAGSLTALGAAEGVAVLPQWISNQVFGTKTIYTWEPGTGLKANSAETNTILQQYTYARDTRTMLLKRATNTLTFNLQLNHVSEESLKDIERKMVDINTVIREATRPGAIITLCNNLSAGFKKQCKGKNFEAPSCDK